MICQGIWLLHHIPWQGWCNYGAGISYKVLSRKYHPDAPTHGIDAIFQKDRAFPKLARTAKISLFS